MRAGIVYSILRCWRLSPDFVLSFLAVSAHISIVTARLGIPADRMPDLACLVGNDWIQPDNHVHRQGQFVCHSPPRFSSLKGEGNELCAILVTPACRQSTAPGWKR